LTELTSPIKSHHGDLLDTGDPAGEVAAHNAKECLREIYTLWGQPDMASQLGALIADLARHRTPEQRGMARTLGRWRT
jgi:hypothetical protein